MTMPDSLQSRIEDAHSFLSGRVRRTPVETSPGLSERMGTPVHLKLESLQVTGSFKIRGAWFAIHRLGEKAHGGVATCSAGNHGLGLAYAGREMGIPVRVYVPRSVDASKERGLRALGAEVVRSGYDGFDDTEEWAIADCRGRGLPYVSAYDDESVMAGNGGSLGLEIVEQVPKVESVVLPVSGGGMAAGMTVPFRKHAPNGIFVAAQLASCPALLRSIEAGQAVTRMPHVETLAGGLEGGLGALPFPLLQENVSQIVTAAEEAVWDAVIWMLAEHRLLVEPSAAVAIAACLSGDVRARGETVVVVSGRNVSVGSLRRILNSKPDGSLRD